MRVNDKNKKRPVVARQQVAEPEFENKKVEEGLRNIEFKFRDFYELNADGITICDMEGKLLDANKAFLDMLGYTIAELKEKTHEQITPKKWHSIEASIVKDQVQKKGHSEQYEKEYIRKDGSIFPVVVRVDVSRGEPMYAWSFIRDITEHKNAEEALKESEERFRSFSEGSFEGIAIIEQGRVIDVNRRFCEIFGYDSDEIIGKKAWELVTSGDVELVKGKIIAEYEKPYECDGMHKNGSVIKLEVCGKSIIYQGRKCRITALSDITERKKAEEELQRAHSRLLKAQRVAQMGFSEWNIKTNEMYWSDEVYKMYGIDPKEKVTIDLTMRLVHPDDLGFVKKNLDMVMKGTKRYNIEHRNLSPDGKVIWIHAHADLTYDKKGNPESLIGSVVDITERKKVEEERAAHLLRNEALVKAIGEIVYDWKPLEDELTWGGQFTQILGYTPDEMGSNTESWTSRVHSDDLQRVLGEIKQATQKHRPYSLEYRFKRNDGSYCWMLDRGETFIDEQGALTRIIGVFSDITERKKVEERLHEQKISLEQKNVALKEILEQVHIEKDRIKDDIAANIRESVLPVLEKLKRKKDSQKYAELLSNHMESIVSSYGREITKKSHNLTPRELEICNMVKGGITSKEIAGLLNLSQLTVEKHRRNIRKKLHISGKKSNLTSFLKTS